MKDKKNNILITSLIWACWTHMTELSVHIENVNTYKNAITPMSFIFANE